MSDSTPHTDKQEEGLGRHATIALAKSAKTTHWANVTRTMREIGHTLSQCQHGSKDGACFLPGALKTNGARSSRDMCAIETLPYDLDTGHPIDDLQTRLKYRGIEAWAYATYNHLMPSTTVRGGVAERWAKLPANTRATDEQVIACLREAKGYAPDVLDGATVQRGESFDAIVTHAPMPRYRVLIPLSRRLLMTELGEVPDTAERAYKALYDAVAAFLGIEHYDASCRDPARVSYTHRRPEGAEPWFWRNVGMLLDPAPFIAEARAKAALAHEDKQAGDYKTPGLARWIALCGDGFRAADFLAQYGQDAKSSEPGKVEAICPLQDQHSDGGDDRRTCYARNPDASQNGHPVTGCNHARCASLKQTVFVDTLLQQHGLGVEALNQFTDTPAPGIESDFGDVIKGTNGAKVPPISHDKLAWRFTIRHADDLRYVATWGRWLLWDGNRWKVEETLAALNMARQIARELAVGRPDAKEIKSAATIYAIERLARADRRHASTTDEWDADPWLLCTPSGTVDLRTGQLCESRREDRITKSTATAPGGECPQWLAFLNTIFAGDQELIGFVQRMLGYSLTGVTREHALFFCYGLGGNGKGTLLETWCDVVGDYGRTAGMKMLTESHHQAHLTELARLRGARTVIAQETESGARWAEVKLKTLTGGDRITANFMRQDHFEFTPAFKLLLAANSKPSLRSVDEAIRRRFYFVPFNVTIAKADRDTELREKLRSEWPGILAWAVRGCLDWQRRGLAPPAAVRDATEAYFREQDPLLGFLAESCLTDDATAVEQTTDLFEAFTGWCTTKGKAWFGGVNEFSRRLTAQGFEQNKHSRTRLSQVWGIKLMRADMYF